MQTAFFYTEDEIAEFLSWLFPTPLSVKVIGFMDNIGLPAYHVKLPMFMDLPADFRELTIEKVYQCFTASESPSNVVVDDLTENAIDIFFTLNAPKPDNQEQTEPEPDRCEICGAQFQPYEFNGGGGYGCFACDFPLDEVIAPFNMPVEESQHEQTVKTPARLNYDQKQAYLKKIALINDHSIEGEKAYYEALEDFLIALDALIEEGNLK